MLRWTSEVDKLSVATWTSEVDKLSVAMVTALIGAQEAASIVHGPEIQMCMDLRTIGLDGLGISNERQHGSNWMATCKMHPPFRCGQAWLDSHSNATSGQTGRCPRGGNRLLDAWTEDPLDQLAWRALTPQPR